MIKIASVILENEKGEILLYLRDNKSGIPFPNHWDLFGGHVEGGETPEEALTREVKEELGIELKEYRLFKIYECLQGDAYANIKYIYAAKLTIPATQLTLREGERLQYFSREELPALKCANILKEIVMEYLSSRSELSYF